jgi:hypothetical protein
MSLRHHMTRRCHYPICVKKLYMLFRHARKIQIQRCMRIESTRHCASSFVDDVMIISYLTDYYGLLETSREAYCTRYS